MTCPTCNGRSAVYCQYEQDRMTEQACGNCRGCIGRCGDCNSTGKVPHLLDFLNDNGSLL